MKDYPVNTSTNNKNARNLPVGNLKTHISKLPIIHHWYFISWINLETSLMKGWINRRTFTFYQSWISRVIWHPSSVSTFRTPRSAYIIVKRDRVLDVQLSGLNRSNPFYFMSIRFETRVCLFISHREICLANANNQGNAARFFNYKCNLRDLKSRNFVRRDIFKILLIGYTNNLVREKS